MTTTTTTSLFSPGSAESSRDIVRWEKHRVADTLKRLYEKHDVQGCSELLPYLFRDLRLELNWLYDSDSEDSDSIDPGPQEAGDAPSGETITRDDGATTIVLEATAIGKFAQSGLLDVILKIATDEDAYNLDETMESEIRRVKLERMEAEKKRKEAEVKETRVHEKVVPARMKPKAIPVKAITTIKSASARVAEEVAQARPRPPRLAVAKPSVPIQEFKKPQSVAPPVFNDKAFILIANVLATLKALCQWLRVSRRHYEPHVRITTLSFALFWRFIWNSWFSILEEIPRSGGSGQESEEQQGGGAAPGGDYVDRVNKARRGLKEAVADLTIEFWKMESMYCNRSQPECEEHLKVALFTWLQIRKSYSGALYVIRKQLERSRATKDEKFKMTTVITAVLSRHLDRTCTLVEAVQALLPILDDAMRDAATAGDGKEMLDIMILYAESLGFEGVADSLADVEPGVPSNEDHLGAIAEAMDIVGASTGSPDSLWLLVVEILCILIRNFDHPHFDRYSILKCVELAFELGDTTNETFSDNCATLKQWIHAQTDIPSIPRKSKRQRGKRRATNIRRTGPDTVLDQPPLTPEKIAAALSDGNPAPCTQTPSNKRKRATMNEEETPAKRHCAMTEENGKPLNRRRSLRLIEKNGLSEHESSFSEFEGDNPHHSYDLRPRTISHPATPEKKKSRVTPVSTPASGLQYSPSKAADQL